MYKNSYSTSKGSSGSFGRKSGGGRNFSGFSKPKSKYSGGGNFRHTQRNRFRGEHIDHEIYTSKAISTQVAQDDMYERQSTFADFNLHPKLVRNIAAKQYVHPTKIQSQVITPILEKKDILGLASTGSGKTAAFLIPVLNTLLNTPSKKCLVVAPTRELVNQIQAEFKMFAQGTGINDVLIVGGASYSTQIRLLKRNHQFVIATPGRLIDLHNQKQVDFAEFDIIVLDEVDQMLDMGFINDIKLIISKLKTTKQSLFFSATMSPKIRDIASTLLVNPVTVDLSSKTAVKNVDQSIVKVNPSKGKVETLHEILINTEFSRVLVFSRTKRNADLLASALRQKGHRVDALHGNKSLNQRTKILSMFKRSEIDVLVATDVASRGIDVPDISHVINYDEPATKDDYIHRIGRTGRIGKTGVALTFV